MMTLSFLLLFINGITTIVTYAATNSRERYSMNFDWSFHLGSQDLQHASCQASSFQKKNNQQCEEFFPIDTVAKNDANACANACCANPTCALFQITNKGECEVGNIISIYNAFSWTSTCKTVNGATFYSREPNTPDTNSSHFSPVAKDFDDSSWPIINLPHDFVVNGTFQNPPPEQEPRSGSHGYLPKNTSWYRKHFSLSTSYNNNNTMLWIDFDGIYRNSIVFINGRFLGNHSSGYTSFRYYLDAAKDSLQFGDNSNNVLSIFVDATAEEGWWYEGGGIYRNVWFNKANKVYFEPNGGIYLPANVSKINNDGTGTGNVMINATINNKYNSDQTVNLNFDIIKPGGSSLQTLSMKNIVIKANSFVTVSPSTSNENVKLWSVDTPSLYTVNCSITDTKGNEIDAVSLRFGYRKVVFDVNNGLFINDQSMLNKGGKVTLKIEINVKQPQNKIITV